MSSATRDEVARVRLASMHKKAWVEAAEADGRTLSDWLRWLADRRLQELGQVVHG